MAALPTISPRFLGAAAIVGGSSIQDNQATFYRTRAPILFNVFGDAGGTTDDTSRIISVAGHTMLSFQVGTGSSTGTYTAFGSLDGVTWVSLGTINANGAILSVANVSAFVRVTVASSIAAYNVTMLAN